MELKVNPKKDALIGPAMKRFSGQLQKAFKAYEKRSLDSKGLQEKLQDILSDALELSATRGYLLACGARQIAIDTTAMHQLRIRADRRAVFAAKLITKSTKRAFAVKAAMSKKKAVSKDRSDDIVEYEMPKIMFMGMRKGWGQVTGTRMPTKSWFITSDNPCELCQENEDEGPVPIDEPFPSGDYEPGIHPGCDCILGLYI
jgi:hypothetical protein